MIYCQSLLSVEEGIRVKDEEAELKTILKLVLAATTLGISK